MRKFSATEIKEILDYSVVSTTRIKSENMDSSLNKIKNNFRLQLEELVVYPEIKEKLKKEIKKKYINALTEAGEMVGIIAAQSIGSDATQLTLNTFHSSGIGSKNVTLGIPRFDELLYATQNPKVVSATIYYKEKPKSVKSLSEMVNNKLKHIILEQLVIGRTINNKYIPKNWHKAYELIYGNEHRDYRWSLSLKLNLKELYMNNITPRDVSDAINNYKEIICIHSPSIVGEVDIFIDTSAVEIDDKKSGLITEDTKEECFINDIIIPILMKTYIKGIKGIKKIFPNKTAEGEWFIETEGSDLLTIMGMENVDGLRTTCDNMWEIKRTLGIEAARTFIINEMNKIIEFGGSYIDKRHLMLLVDMMTNSGTIKAISRYGIGREVGPMAKASFEEGLDNFLRASVMTEVETATGVSASIITGKTGRFGTGLNKMVMDVKMLINGKKKEKVDMKRELKIKIPSVKKKFTKVDVIKNFRKPMVYITYFEKDTMEEHKLSEKFKCKFIDYREIIKGKLFMIELDSDRTVEKIIRKNNDTEINLYNGKKFSSNFTRIMKKIEECEYETENIPKYNEAYEPASPTYNSDVEEDEIYEPSSPVYD